MTRDGMVRMIRANLQNVDAIYLFGSESAGEQHAHSDIDLAVMSNATLLPMRLWEVSQELASRAARDVDLVDLREASTVMRMQVISTGERLFCANEQRCEVFEDFVFSAYARLNEERAAILQDIRGRGSIYG